MYRFSRSCINWLIQICVVLNGCWWNVESRTSPQLKVQLSHGGILVGRHLTTDNGRHMRAFMGIPYAQPPLGELRFKDPIAYGPWEGEKLVVEDADKCIQRDPYRRDLTIEGSEDCLYLNVYTPDISNISKHLPVMVWFHGGGWQCGSGVNSFYGPDFLLNHDIILVSVNYRLGPLGFLSTETLDCPGNFGLKDQVEVLKWIQSHIDKFGGDPHSVTIFGESAGGASVTYHIMSPLSKGLFHKGIAQSGTYFDPWAQPAYPGVASERAKEAANMLNCHTNNSNNTWSDIVQCLRKKEAADVVETFYKLFKWDTDPMIPYPPVIEPDNNKAFITKLPRDEDNLYGSGIPLMIGLTSEEGLLKTASLLNLPKVLNDFKKNFDKVLPIILYYDHLNEKTQQSITTKLRNFYLKDGLQFDKNNYENITELFSDGWFIAGIDEYIRKRLKTQNVGPTFVYLFEHKGAASFTEIFHGGREEYYGACHAEELQYLFAMNKLFVSAVPTENDLRLRRLMTQLWVNFAYYGDPTPNTLQYADKWLPSHQYPVNYAHIGSKEENSDQLLKHRSGGFYNERLEFWHLLKPHTPSLKYQHNEL